MSKDKKNIELMATLIKTGEVIKVKKLVEQGINIHHENDYFLYLAVFAKNEELQRYFIDLGLDCEITKGRMAVAHPEGLANLRKYKQEKIAKDFATKLNNYLPKNNKTQPKIKI